MMLRKNLILLVILWIGALISQGPLFAQEASPKREFRAVWIATVNNIDFPSKPTRSSVALKEQWKKLVSKYKEMGFNALIVQIRPSGDAFYPSELAPWSKYLTGNEGIGPDKDFNPLAYMIEETHRQGLEFHAWMNPFRATMTNDTLNLATNHQFFKNRDWLVKYGRRLYLNPGLPEVRDYVIQVISEVVSNYEIDAIHFDDYFYPYKIKNRPFPDSILFQARPGRFTDIEDWRRNNVDVLIEEVSAQIKLTKPYVKLGISPFGVWRNKIDDPVGSETEAGVTSYDDVYADVLKWLRMGWIDYVVPQLYWHIGFEKADHEALVKWWSTHSSDRQLYIGHAAYKVANNSEKAWSDPNEIPKQIKLSRKNWKSQGSVYFSSASVLSNPLGVRDSIAHYYKYPALHPELTDLEMRRPQAPKLKKVKGKKDGVKISWKVNKADLQKLPAYFVVYRVDGFGANEADLEEPKNILDISSMHSNGAKHSIMDYTAEADEMYTYVITAVNRNHKEGNPSKRQKILKLEKGLKNLKKPVAGSGKSKSKSGIFNKQKKSSFFD